MLAKARREAAAGRYDRAAGLVEEAASSEKSAGARAALARAARGFRAAAKMRGWIAVGVRGGRELRVYVEIAGRPSRCTLVGADEGGVAVRLSGNEMRLTWPQISPRRFLAMARKYAPKDAGSALEDFVFASGLEGK